MAFMNVLARGGSRRAYDKVFSDLVDRAGKIKLLRMSGDVAFPLKNEGPQKFIEDAVGVKARPVDGWHGVEGDAEPLGSETGFDEAISSSVRSKRR